MLLIIPRYAAGVVIICSWLAFCAFANSRFGQQFTFFLSVSAPLGGQKLTKGDFIFFEADEIVE